MSALRRSLIRVRWHFRAAGVTSFLVIFLTACGGGGSTSTTAPPNPVPTITSISPSGTTAGGSAFTLMVRGSNFISGSAVEWNGNSRPTSFVGNSQLTAQISAADIAASGAAPITVSNPSPGGGGSNPLTFCTTDGAGPASGQTLARLGAYYFDGWSGPLTNFQFNGLVNGQFQDRQPLSGWQDNTPCAVEQQLAWAHEFGINFFVFDWYYNTAVNDPGEDLNSALKITHSLANRHGMQFALLYVNSNPFIIGPADWSSAIREWIAYMQDAAYVLVKWVIVHTHGVVAVGHRNRHIRK